jgi:hypothetical protein
MKGSLHYDNQTFAISSAIQVIFFIIRIKKRCNIEDI